MRGAEIPSQQIVRRKVKEFLVTLSVNSMNYAYTLNNICIIF